MADFAPRWLTMVDCPVDGRPDHGVIEVGLGQLDARLSLSQLGLGLLDLLGTGTHLDQTEVLAGRLQLGPRGVPLVAPLVEQLPRHQPVVEQTFCPLQVQLGKDHVGLSLVDRRLCRLDLLRPGPGEDQPQTRLGRLQVRARLRHLGPDIPLLEANQHLSFLHVIIPVDPDPFDPPRDPRAQLDLASGHDVAARGENRSGRGGIDPDHPRRFDLHGRRPQTGHAHSREGHQP
jgi:hypothetical protein